MGSVTNTQSMPCENAAVFRFFMLNESTKEANTTVTAYYKSNSIPDLEWVVLVLVVT